MLSAELMILQTVEVSDTVAANQVMVLVIVSFTFHVGVYGIACVEERITQLVLLAEGISQAAQSGNFQFVGIAVVLEVVQNVSRSLQGTYRGLLHVLLFVAETQ